MLSLCIALLPAVDDHCAGTYVGPTPPAQSLLDGGHERRMLPEEGAAALLAADVGAPHARRADRCSRVAIVERNLTRGARLLLPSGQDVAKHMGADVLTDEDLGLPGGGQAPLWYYILKEAEVQAGGVRLGQVGGRIVAEVFLGLMEKDPSSYLHQQPNWTPTLPAKKPGDFAMVDLINVSGHGLEVIAASQSEDPPAPTA